MRQLEIDCRGMQCPAPILQVATAARELSTSPALLHVFANDTDFRPDLEAWCRAVRAKVRWQSTAEQGVLHAVVALNGAAETDAVAAQQSQASVAPEPTHRAVPVEASSPILDLCGVPAHVAVLRLTSAVLDAPEIRVRCDDPQFQSALYAWASATRAEVHLHPSEGAGLVAQVRLTADASGAVAHEPSARLVDQRSPLPLAETAPPRATLLVLHNDLECLLGALLSANAFAAQGMEVVMYFSFWGVNVLRGRNKHAPRERKSMLQRLMQWFMPKGPRRQRLGKLHMGGVGTGMMQHFMRRNNVLPLSELLDRAVEQNVRFQVCTMSMGVMGIRKADLMDLPNLEFAGVTHFAESARNSAVSLTF